MNPDSDDVIANHALHLAMEWGEAWLTPVQSRLSRAYPNLTTSELDDYDRVARDAMHHGHGLVRSLVEELGPYSPLVHSRWRDAFLAYAPWVTQENLARLFSQGMYYSMK